MVLLLGVGFAIYWSSSLALLQELIPVAQLLGANSAVLIAVQGGMLAAGALVGFVYERAGLAGILAIDGATYLLSALFFYLLRSGYFPPHGVSVPTESPNRAPLSGESPAGERLTDERETAPPEQLATDTRAAPVLILESLEPNPVRSVLSDIAEGLRYLHTQPAVLALGLTYACMMAGVISANVIVVALASDLLHAGARGYGFIEGGWALGAVTGGLAAGALSRRHPFTVLISALFVLACGHALFPYAGSLSVAVAMNVVFGACRAIVAVLTQSSIPGGRSREAHGSHPIGLCGDGDHPASCNEPGAGLDSPALELADSLPAARSALRLGDIRRDARPRSVGAADQASRPHLTTFHLKSPRQNGNAAGEELPAAAIISRARSSAAPNRKRNALQVFARRPFQKRTQLARARRMTQLPQRLGFDLPDAFASHGE